MSKQVKPQVKKPQPVHPAVGQAVDKVVRQILAGQK